ncbi:hypothetical protein GBA52_018192 [Prunus armeniaca]|nr:hypothetical protein GBA52_018192 [Prunus armeniaca]
MSPEYAMGGMFSEKIDGYSFGVLQLEIISGKKNTSFYSSDQHIGFLAYVHIDGDDDGDVSGDGGLFGRRFRTTGCEINLKEIALLEGKVNKLCCLLKEAVERTKDNIVKKQALTYEEIKAEPEEQEEIETESHDEENEQQIHNPLKLPLGPDGKIIYYWMYKLHGLGQEFKCEICGDSSYFGRRAFEIHFNGECHKRGMRCLGIPKTKSFNEITSIEEAKELWKRIQERQGENLWCPDLGEEYEDEEGNIYNKKTYNDLKRQGLL